MKKIIVAEDDQFLKNAYRVKLTKEGFETKMASDGLELLEVIKTFVPDLIILDLVMPNMDGFEVLAELKANDKWKHIPVVIASNLGQKDDIDQGMKLGAVDYFIKTELSLDELVSKIKSLIK